MRIHRWDVDDRIVYGAAIGVPVALALYAVARRASASPLVCNTQYLPARLSGPRRSPSQIRWIVIHSTEGGTGASNASYFQSPDSGGSTQLIVGEDGCYRSVDDLMVPAGAPGSNYEGLHIEFVGMAAWPKTEWMKRQKTLELGAKAIANWSRKYGIPLKVLGPGELKNPASRGVTTHAAVSTAFRQTDHMDPGGGFPMSELLSTARRYL